MPCYVISDTHLEWLVHSICHSHQWLNNVNIALDNCKKSFWYCTVFQDWLSICTPEGTTAELTGWEMGQIYHFYHYTNTPTIL